MLGVLASSGYPIGEIRPSTSLVKSRVDHIWSWLYDRLVPEPPGSTQGVTGSFRAAAKRLSPTSETGRRRPPAPAWPLPPRLARGALTPGPHRRDAGRGRPRRASGRTGAPGRTLVLLVGQPADAGREPGRVATPAGPRPRAAPGPATGRRCPRTARGASESAGSPRDRRSSPARPSARRIVGKRARRFQTHGA